MADKVLLVLVDHDGVEDVVFQGRVCELLVK